MNRNEMTGPAQKTKAPLRRILLYAFCAAMFAVMIALLIVRCIRDGANAHPEKLIGNAALWLVPVACRLLFRDKVSDLVLWVYCVFTFLASFLGTVMGGYAKVWWYDLAMHTASGYLVSFFGLFLVCKLADVRSLSPALTVIACFAVSVAVAGLWEIFEFVTDLLFDGVAQGYPIESTDGTIFRSVNDTMEDMICGTCGALAFVIHYLAHVFSKKSLLLDTFKRDFTGAERYDAAGTGAAGGAAPAADAGAETAETAEKTNEKR